MRILVVGDGKVGHTLAEQLTREGHDVVVIDNNETVLQRCEDALDVMCIQGNGANARTLMDAGVDKADILVAATASDEINMLCCLIAKRLGAQYTIARIRDPEYNASLTLLQHETGVDMAVNPERATAMEISRLLRFPFANNIEYFARGQVEMVEFRAQEKDIMVGCPLRKLSSRMPEIPRVLYAAVEREGRVIIPNGDFVIQPGDRVHVAGEMMTVTNYFRFLGKHSLRIKNVMLLGGGRISYYLAKMIVPMGIRVALIEINPAKAASLSEMLPHVNVIQGDGTDQDLLEQEGLQQMDAFVAMCDRDEENLMTGLFAGEAGRAQGDCEKQPRSLCGYYQRHGAGQHCQPQGQHLHGYPALCARPGQWRGHQGGAPLPADEWQGGGHGIHCPGERPLYRYSPEKPGGAPRHPGGGDCPPEQGDRTLWRRPY